MKTRVRIRPKHPYGRMSIKAARFAQVARTTFADERKQQRSVSQTRQNQSQLQNWDNEGGRFEKMPYYGEVANLSVEKDTP